MRVGGALTHQLAPGFQLKVGTELAWKDYQGTPLFDETGYPTAVTRDDVRREYFFRATKTISTGWRLPQSIDVFGNILLRDNDSNDPFYHYFDHIGLFGLTLKF